MPDVVDALVALDELERSDRRRGFFDIAYSTPTLEKGVLVSRWSNGLEGRGKLIWNGEEWQ